MILPTPGVAFTSASDGDARGNNAARIAVSTKLGIASEWGVVHQVHGSSVVEAAGPGLHGDADALFTAVPGLPLAVFTADCAGVVVQADGGVGVAHSGWRGAASGVVANLLRAMLARGLQPVRAFLGPSIGPCCFEVGPEVAARFPGFVAVTEWGTTSVDLWAAISAQLDGLEVEDLRHCTRHEGDTFSHRRDGTDDRMAAIGWWAG